MAGNHKRKLRKRKSDKMIKQTKTQNMQQSKNKKDQWSSRKASRQYFLMDGRPTELARKGRIHLITYDIHYFCSPKYDKHKQIERF